MATLTSTGVTFSDGTALASAAPTVSQVGGITFGFYTLQCPSQVSNTDGPSIPRTLNNYGTGTTISGSSLAYDVKRSYNSTNSFYQASTPYAYGNANGSIGVYVKVYASNSGAKNFPSSQVVTNGTYISYSTASGSWRSLSGFSIVQYYNGCCQWQAEWGSALWQRYA
jgi:hypothetical protein